jgi:hypothetical protein
MRPVNGWGPTQPDVLYVLADVVARLCELPVALTNWGKVEDEDLLDLAQTPWEEALSDFDTLYAGHARIDWPSPNTSRWSARRALHPTRFDRWAAELAYGAYGLSRLCLNGTGDHRDAKRQRAEQADLRRRLAVLSAGPLVETRWRRPKGRYRNLLCHWQSIAEPPWLDEAVGIDEGLVDLVEALWRAGMPTVYCCQGGGRQGLAYITFGNTGSADWFTALLDGDGWEVEGTTVRFDPSCAPLPDPRSVARCARCGSAGPLRPAAETYAGGQLYVCAAVCGCP